MAPSRPRASSSANPRTSPVISQNHTPNKKAQRPRRGSAQAVATHSPSSTPARSGRVSKDENAQSTRTPEPAGEIGMSPAERYYKNLRVLRRRDPHIVSIFDQFAHVTVYYMQDDMSMERAGYEGTLFFFERDIEPKYGLFILNRQGMNDYIRYLLHDDVFEPMGDAVWISTLMPSSRNAMGDEDKTAGFWAMAMDVRETLGDMMMRLAPYIRRGERYPDEYRYGPDRAVPQQNYFAGGTREDVKHDFLRDLPDDMREKIIKTVQSAKAKAQNEEFGDEQGPQLQASSANASRLQEMKVSELDQLFSKLGATQTPPLNHIPSVPAPQENLTGKALLDTMFASVSPPATRPNGTGEKLTLQQLGLAPPVTSPPDSMEIISPKPSAAGLPQILTTNVIDELMGLPSSDSRSASRSSTSASLSEYPRSPRSNGVHRSKERGYVADSGEDDGITSEASTNIDVDNQTAGNLLERLFPGVRTTFLTVGNTGHTGSLKGDATPRARVEELQHASPPPKSQPDLTQTVSADSVRRPAGGKKSTNQVAAGSRTVSAPTSVRAPFQSGAELWPGTEPSTSAELAQSASTIANSNDVVELDFSEIGALDDARTFQSKGSGSSRGKGPRAKPNGTISAPNGIHTNGTAQSKPKDRTKADARQKTDSIQPATSAQSTFVGRNVVEHSIRAVLMESKLLTSEGQPLNKTAFVREVLTLIHTDNSFVDKLYESYQQNLSKQLQRNHS